MVPVMVSKVTVLLVKLIYSAVGSAGSAGLDGILVESGRLSLHSAPSLLRGLVGTGVFAGNHVSRHLLQCRVTAVTGGTRCPPPPGT